MELPTLPQLPMMSRLDSDSSQSRSQSDKDEEKFWLDYLEKADSFDKRIVKEWNKIVDVILVYVALFIAVLSSFVIETSKNFQRNPADITNDFLNATYHLMVAQTNNISIPIIDTTSFYTLGEDDYNRAVISNALLYAALALCAVVSVIALAAKLWLVTYSDRTFNFVGSPYHRAMKRQKIHNGVLTWKLEGVLKTLPIMLLIVVVMFGFFIHIAASALNPGIGFAVGTVIYLGFVSLAITTFAATFIPECPFYSPFSAFIRIVFEYPGKFLEKQFGISPKGCIILWLSILLCIGSAAAIAYGCLKYSPNIFALVFVPLAITFEYAMQEDKSDTRKPQKYMLPSFTLVSLAIIAPIMGTSGYFIHSTDLFIILYSVGISLLILAGLAARRLAKSTKQTKEIDAIAWLLNSEPKLDKIKSLLKRIIRLTRDDGHYHHYRARLLDSLMPLLSSLILVTSSRHKIPIADSQLEYLETYVTCLAQLSDFKNDRLWSWKSWCESCDSWMLLREDAKQHATLKRSLKKRLVKLIQIEDNSSNLKEAAKVILRNYGMDEHGDISGNASSKTTELTHPYDKA